MLQTISPNQLDTLFTSVNPWVRRTWPAVPHGKRWRMTGCLNISDTKTQSMRLQQVWSPISKKRHPKKKHKQLLCEYVGYWMHVFKATSFGTCVKKQDSVLPLCPYQMSFWNLPWFTSSPLTLFFDDGASLNLNDSDTRQYQKYPKTNNWIGPADLKIWKKFGFFSVLQIVYLTNGCPTSKTDFISLLEVFVGNDFLRKDWKNINSPVKGFVQTNVYPQVDKL